MRTVELIEEAVAVLHRIGYQIRQEWLEGSGGACEIAGKKCFFVDLALSRSEQLEQLIDALQNDKMAGNVRMSSPLKALCGFESPTKRAA